MLCKFRAIFLFILIIIFHLFSYFHANILCVLNFCQKSCKHYQAAASLFYMNAKTAACTRPYHQSNAIQTVAFRQYVELRCMCILTMVREEDLPNGEA